MTIFLPEEDQIYCAKTRVYFKEVMSSYAVGNYRSAIVMLYSVAICDILFKLQELKDMYNDKTAAKILSEVNESRDQQDQKSKSRWEKELVDNVYSRTKLLGLEEYTNLNHLYDHRNFSAHPALNDNYELISPSKEITIAHIRNILIGILIKPPVFIKNVIEMMTEDLREKKEIYINHYDDLSKYLNNKYYSKMPTTMKYATLKAFWKFCFYLSDDENCKNNIVINRTALEILIDTFPETAADYIKKHSNLFTISNDYNSVMNLIVLLGKFPMLFEIIEQDAKFKVENLIDKENVANVLAWFKYSSAKDHFYNLKNIKHLSIGERPLRMFIQHYMDIGETQLLLDFLIYYYGQSYNFDDADQKFKLAIEPYLNLMNADQFIELIKVINENNQIYKRGAAYASNNAIIKAAHKFLQNDFDYSQYPNFKFDSKIIGLSDGDIEEELPQDDSDELPF